MNYRVCSDKGTRPVRSQEELAELLLAGTNSEHEECTVVDGTCGVCDGEGITTFFPNL